MCCGASGGGWWSNAEFFQGIFVVITFLGLYGQINTDDTVVSHGEHLSLIKTILKDLMPLQIPGASLLFYLNPSPLRLLMILVNY